MKHIITLIAEQAANSGTPPVMFKNNNQVGLDVNALCSDMQYVDEATAYETALKIANTVRERASSMESLNPVIEAVANKIVAVKADLKEANHAATILDRFIMQCVNADLAAEPCCNSDGECTVKCLQWNEITGYVGAERMIVSIVNGNRLQADEQEEQGYDLALLKRFIDTLNPAQFGMLKLSEEQIAKCCDFCDSKSVNGKQVLAAIVGDVSQIAALITHVLSDDTRDCERLIACFDLVREVAPVVQTLEMQEHGFLGDDAVETQLRECLTYLNDCTVAAGYLAMIYRYQWLKDIVLLSNGYVNEEQMSKDCNIDCVINYRAAFCRDGSSISGRGVTCAEIVESQGRASELRAKNVEETKLAAKAAMRKALGIHLAKTLCHYAEYQGTPFLAPENCPKVPARLSSMTTIDFIADSVCDGRVLSDLILEQILLPVMPQEVTVMYGLYRDKLAARASNNQNLDADTLSTIEVEIALEWAAPTLGLMLCSQQ